MHFDLGAGKVLEKHISDLREEQTSRSEGSIECLVLAAEGKSIQLEASAVESSGAVALVERPVEFEPNFVPSYNVDTPLEPFAMLNCGSMGLDEYTVA